MATSLKHYQRKLSGSILLSLRILLYATFLGMGIYLLYLDNNYELKNIACLMFCALDIALTAAFLICPSITTEGNGYINCLPFLLNSVACSVSSFFVNSSYMYYQTETHERVKIIVSGLIVALLVYGGVASPINTAWMETFKPFQRVDVSSRGRRKSSVPALN